MGGGAARTRSAFHSSSDHTAFGNAWMPLTAFTLAAL
jgi:hypothetical protein